MAHLNLTFMGMPKSKQTGAMDTETQKSAAKQAGENNAKAKKSLEDRIDALNIDKKEQLKAKRDAGRNVEAL